jgi:hypothetical protein
MNARPPCLASQDADAHARRLGDDEAASEFWAVQAARQIRDALVPARADDWFACNVPGPEYRWSADEILSTALDSDHTPVRAAFSELMASPAAYPLLRVLIDFWLESRGEAIAAALERQARQEARIAA